MIIYWESSCKIQAIILVQPGKNYFAIREIILNILFLQNIRSLFTSHVVCVLQVIQCDQNTKLHP